MLPGRAGPERNAQAHEQARDEPAVRVVEDGPRLQGSRRGVETRIDEVEAPLVRRAILVGQARVDRHVPQRVPRQATLLHGPLQARDVALVDGEVGVDRVDLRQRRDLRRAAFADELAGIDLAAADAAVEGGRHVGVAEIDLRQLQVRLRLRDGRPLGVPVGQRLVVIRGGRHRLPLEDGLALVLGLGALEKGLVLLDGRLGQVHLRHVLAGLDDVEHLTLPHVRAVRGLGLLEEARDAGDEIDAHDSRRLAGEGRFVLDRLGQGRGDGDLGRCGGNEDGIAVAARQSNQEGKRRCSCRGEPYCRPLHATLPEDNLREPEDEQPDDPYRNHANCRLGPSKGFSPARTVTRNHPSR